MNYKNLKTEIDNDPTNKGYKNLDTTWKDDETITGLLNATMTIQSRIPGKNILQWAAENQLLSMLADNQNHANVSVRNAVIGASRIADSPGDAGLDTGKSTNVNMIDALVAVGLVSSIQKKSLMELGEQATTRAIEIKLGRVAAGHVFKARKA